MFNSILQVYHKIVGKMTWTYLKTIFLPFKIFNSLTFQIEKETITITDEEMIRGMKIVAERMKLVCLSLKMSKLLF